MAESKTGHVNTLNYLKMFFRRKELIIIPAFLGLVVGISAGILAPKKYRSSTVILVQEGKTDNPLFRTLAVSTTVRERLNTIRESMLGWNSLVKLVKRLELDKDVKTRRDFENLILRVRRNIVIRLRAHNIIEVSYVDEDPVRAQAVVKTITDIFIERNREIQTQEINEAIRFIEQQLRVYKSKIKSAEIAKLEDQLQELLTDATEKHPMVKQLRERIAAKRRELKEENLEFIKDETLSVETTNPLIESIRKALDSFEGDEGAAQKADSSDDLYKAMMMERLTQAVARDIRVNDQIYNMLLQRLETARITKSLQLSKEGTRYEVIDPPRVPLEPFQPNRLVMAVMGLVLGATAGFGLVFFREFFDKSFIDVEDAKEYLGVPLLGAISKINTDFTLRRERERKQWMYSLTVLSGAMIVIVTLTIANFLK